MKLGFFNIKERRRYTRSYLDLPVEYRLGRVQRTHGGIAIDGGEGGFLMHCPYDMPVGTRLSITVMFPDGFELKNFQAQAEVVRKDNPGEGQGGFKYGLKLFQVKKEESPKLRHLLQGLHQLLGGETPGF
jgi:hypothetical protein